MKHLLYLTLALLMAHLVRAQNENPQLERLRRSFEPILTQQVPKGILADATPGSGVFERHNGVYGDSMNDPIEVFDVLLNLRNAAVNPTALPTRDAMLSRIAEFKKANIIPVSYVNYAYARLKPEAFMDGIVEMDETSEQFRYTTDPTGFFEMDTVVAFGVHGLIDNASTARFVFPSDLALVNLNGNPPMWVDFGDGQGFRVLEFDKVYTVTYGWPESDHREILVTLSNTNVPANPAIFKGITSRTMQTVYPMPELSLMTSQVSVNSPCFNPDHTGMADARFYIRYGKNQSVSKQIKKPFILVEGFDVDLNPHDDKFGLTDWTTFISGMSFDERNRPVNENLKDLKVLAERLYQESFDVVLVDFRNGADDLFKNGNALIKIIQWVNEHKTGDEGISIMGASMGGLLARYAVRTMEIEGCGPCTKLYGTFDSPHQGANVPAGLQVAVKELGFLSTEAEMAYNLLSSPAAKQMLRYNHSDPTGAVRANWQNHLDQIGHPQIPKRIAITNGSPDGSGNEIVNAGDIMLNTVLRARAYVTQETLGAKVILMDNGVSLADMSLFSQNSDEKSKVYLGKVISKASLDALTNSMESIESGDLANKGFFKKMSKLKKIKAQMRTVTIEQKTEFVTPGEPVDNCSGGQSDYLSILASAFENIDRDEDIFKKSGKIEITVNFASAMTNFTGGNFNTTFVPTFSALDMTEKELNPDLAAMMPHVGNINKAHSPNPEIHPFHSINFSNLQSNQFHVFVNAKSGENIDYIMNELTSTEYELPLSLPVNIDKTTFNFNDESNFAKRIGTITINSGGNLMLNSEGNGRFGDGVKPTKTNIISEFYTENCETRITVSTNGILSLGNNNNELGLNNRAILHIMPGDVLALLSQSTLTIHRGSKVIVEEGATLIYEDNANIQLFGEASDLEIRGRVLIKNGATFRVSQMSGSDAGTLTLVYTDKNQGQALYPSGNEAKVELMGNAPWSGKLLQIKSGPAIFKGFNNVSITKASITLYDHGSIEAHDNFNAEYLYFKSAEDQEQTTAIRTFGQAQQNISLNKFENLNLGIELVHNTNYPDISFQNNYFMNCKTAIHASSCNPEFVENRFENCETALVLSDIPSFKIINGLFKGNNIGLTTIYEPSNYDGFIEDVLFLNNHKAIDFQGNGNVVMSCNRFYSNNLAINTTANLNLSSTYTMDDKSGGYNTFYLNDGGIVTEGGDIYLKNGHNNFISSYQKGDHHFIEGLLSEDAACLNSEGNMEAEDNYWFPIPSNGVLSHAGSNYYKIYKVAYPHISMVRLLGDLENVADGSCFDSNDEDLPSEQQQQKRNEYAAIQATVNCFPNPFSQDLTLVLQLPVRTDVRINVSDATGRQVFSEFLQDVPEGNSVHYLRSLDKLESGLYIVNLQSAVINTKLSIIKK